MGTDDIPARRPRADSLRNRELLLSAAKAAFTEGGAEVALEEIARRAGVGIGTLYRHFPSRDALLAAVYRREVEQLSASADSLLSTRPPDVAMEAWLNLVVDYMATKLVVASALQASTGEAGQVYAASGPALLAAMEKLLLAAQAAGRIRPDFGPDDLMRALVGMSYGFDRPDWERGARRLISVTMAGLRI